MMKRIISVLLCVLMTASLMMTGMTGAFAAQTAPDDSALSENSKQGDLAPSGVSLDDPMIVPRVEVTTENGNGTSLLKSDGYVPATVAITDTDGSVLTDACSIKVRGNTTAFDSIPKKAFAFKFAKKKDVLGMGKGKKWVLLANCYDPTLLRNYLANDFARELGLDYTCEQKFVELWLDGSYRGCYTLYEPIQAGKDRVEIDVESNNGQKDFLIEYEQLANEEDVKYFTVGGVRFSVKEPDKTTDEQAAYVSGVMTDIINVLKTGDRDQIAAVIDIPSFVKFYLVNEFMKNMDFDMSSVYYYYKDGKLYAGPVWDFDKSSGNTADDINASRAMNSHISTGIMQDQQTLYKYIGRQSWFVDGVRRVYEEHYDYIESIGAEDGLLDTLRSEYGELFARNFTVWNVARRWVNYQFQPYATYEENYSYFKNWCYERNSWLFDHYDLFAYEYCRGDADGNGEVEVTDATVIQRALVNLRMNDSDGHMELRAAVTDDQLNIIDATVIQRYIAQMGNPYALAEKVKIKLRQHN